MILLRCRFPFPSSILPPPPSSFFMCGKSNCKIHLLLVRTNHVQGDSAEHEQIISAPCSICRRDKSLSKHATKMDFVIFNKNACFPLSYQCYSLFPHSFLRFVSMAPGSLRVITHHAAVQRRPMLTITTKNMMVFIKAFLLRANTSSTWCTETVVTRVCSCDE